MHTELQHDILITTHSLPSITGKRARYIELKPALNLKRVYGRYYNTRNILFMRLQWFLEPVNLF
jgi:hypothetical protein